MHGLGLGFAVLALLALTLRNSLALAIACLVVSLALWFAGTWHDQQDGGA